MSDTLPEVTFCSWCGGGRAGGGHEACDRRLALVDPPRYCPSCARRMVVQVDPMGWTARCSRHGESRAANTPRPGEQADGGAGPSDRDR